MNGLPVCKECGKYLTLLDRAICWECRDKKPKQKRRLIVKATDRNEAEVGLIAVLKRRISTALARSRKESNKKGKHEIHGSADITMTYLLMLYDEQKGCCALTGKRMSLGSFGQSKYDSDVLSIDRIDPKQGYIIGNVQFVTHQANIAKNRYTSEEFLQLCRDVVIEAERKSR